MFLVEIFPSQGHHLIQVYRAFRHLLVVLEPLGSFFLVLWLALNSARVLSLLQFELLELRPSASSV